MIDNVTSDDLERLAETTADHCISMFLPTHRSGPEQSQDPIRLGNLLTRAANELDSLGVRGRAAHHLLGPAAALRYDGAFWAHQDNGLALYLAEGSPSAGSPTNGSPSTGSPITYRLPDPLDELLVIADRFHVKPVIGSLATGRAFHVLALSRQRIRLLRGGPTHLTEIELGDIPQSLAEALWWDDRERQVQSHAASRVGRGRVTATFHGHGGTRDAGAADIARFLRAVDVGLERLIADTSTPLILAGVDRLVAAYRRSSRYPNIVDGAIPGNVDQVHPDELHARAWQLAAPILDRGRAAAAEAFLTGTSPTSSSVVETVLAARAGRVGTLFVPTGVQLWGTIDPDGPQVDEHDTRRPGDRDLLDTAAVDTLTHRGTVYTSDGDGIPGGGPLAAILRY